MKKYVYTKQEIKDVIRQLENYEIGCYDVPEELRIEESILSVERKLGLRKTGRRGYDDISDSFFVEEVIVFEKTENVCTYFKDFDSYYSFLGGDIYENACYYQLDFSMIKRFVDMDKISIDPYIEKDINDYTWDLSAKEIDDYNKVEHIKVVCKKWVEKFNTCDTYAKLVECVQDYVKSELSQCVELEFFFFQYIFKDICDKDRFNVIMEYMSHEEYPTYHLIYGLWLVYNEKDVIDSFTYLVGSKQTYYKHKQKLKYFINLQKNMTLNKHCYLDPKTHYYCEELSNRIVSVRRYFEDFGSFIAYRKGNLTNCDFSNVYGLKFDWSKCKTDSTTKLPCDFSGGLKYSLCKRYDGVEFIVQQTWQDSNKNVIREKNLHSPGFLILLLFSGVICQMRICYFVMD